MSVRPFLRAGRFPRPFVPEGRAAVAAAGAVESRRAFRPASSRFGGNNGEDSGPGHEARWKLL